ncbi:MAG: hypothetical protein LUG95_02020 [Clostridiales bacterium]|nr:hypothetical protein [Clostridiales bacterium]
MKKLLSITTALCIAVTSLFTGITAFADTVSPTKSEISSKNHCRRIS